MKRARACAAAIGVVLLAAPAALLAPRQPAGSASGPDHDVVIRNGRVMDPESGLDAVRNIGLRHGVISSITAAPLRGRSEIDAAGLVVAPGFIDTDGYAENAHLQVMDGVTTVFDIREGTADVAGWYSERAGKVLINFGVGVGYIRVRGEVMGEAYRFDRQGQKPSDPQLVEILRRVGLELDAGGVALGMGSSGWPDPTGWEHVEAFKVAAGAGAHVVATLRDDSWPQSNTPANLAQMIGAAALSGAQIHVPHLISSAGPRHARALLEMMARARARGLEVTAEDYPYVAAVIWIGPGEMDKWSDDEIREIQPVGAGERLTRGSYAAYRERQFLAFAHNDVVEPLVEPLLAEALAHPQVSIASHGSSATWTRQGRGHPRTAGTFSRLLGHYVRERRLLPLMEALRKMTLMPAQRLERRVPAMRSKGRVREGADADIVAFDADRISDRATFQEQRPSQGVRYVWVNGTLVVRDGALQPAVRAGRPVRAPTKRP